LLAQSSNPLSFLLLVYKSKQFNFSLVIIGAANSSNSKDAISEFTCTASNIEIVYLFKTVKTCLP